MERSLAPLALSCWLGKQAGKQVLVRYEGAGGPEHPSELFEATITHVNYWPPKPAVEVVLRGPPSFQWHDSVPISSVEQFHNLFVTD